MGGIQITSGGAAQAASGLMSANSYLQMAAMLYYMIAKENIQNQTESSIAGYDSEKEAGKQMAKLSINEAIKSGVGAGIQFTSVGLSTGLSSMKNNEIDVLDNKQTSTKNMINKLNQKQFNGAEFGENRIAAAPETDWIKKAKLPPTKNDGLFDPSDFDESYKNNKNFLQKKMGQSELDFNKINSDIDNFEISKNPFANDNNYFKDSLDSINPNNYQEVKKGLTAHAKNYGNQMEILGQERNAAVMKINTGAEAFNGIVNAFVSGFNAKRQELQAAATATGKLYEGISSSQAQGIQMALSAAQGLLDAIRQQSQILVSAAGNDSSRG